MKAIVTKYHGPTDRRGSRISASDSDGNRVTIPYPYDLSGEDCHREAAEALCKKMNWPAQLIGGGLRNGYVFVFSPQQEENGERNRYAIHFHAPNGTEERWYQYHPSITAAREHAQRCLKAEYPDGRGGTRAELVCVLRTDEGKRGL